MSSGAPTDPLSPASRALLDSARASSGPDAAAIARMRGKIDAAVAGTSAATTATLGPKLAVLGLVAAVATGVLVYRESSRSAMPGIDVRVERTRRAVDAAPKLEAPLAAPAPRAPEEIQSSTVPTTIGSSRGRPAEGATDDALIEMAPTSARPSEVKRAPTMARPIDLAREVELVDRAMAAMKRGDTALALDAVRLHARETGGKGQLAEDAAAIEIEAMCRSHQPAAAKLAAFDTRWPTSAQRARLSSSCKDDRR